MRGEGGLPRGITLLARLLLPARDREFVLGDLEELHGAWVAREGRVRALLRSLRALVGSAVAARWPGRSAGAGGRVPTQQGARAGSDLLFDLLHAARSLRREPALVLVVSLTLGAGLGAAGAVFSLANRLLLQPLPGVVDSRGAAHLAFASPDRPEAVVPGPLLDEVRRGATLLSGLAAEANVSGVHVSVAGARPLSATGTIVYGDYFELLGVTPVAGRLLTAEENGPGGDPSLVVISERLWSELFGRSPEAVGAELIAGGYRPGGYRLRVVGVAGGGFVGTTRNFPADFWVPASALATLRGLPPEGFWAPDFPVFQFFLARPRAGVGFEAAAEQLDGLLTALLAAQIAAPTARASADGRGPAELRATLHPGLDVHPLMRGLLEPLLDVLAAAGLVVLLIPCANVANLLLVRGLHRRGEIAVRRALGASPGRIVRRVLTETFLLGALGGLAGLATAWAIGLGFRGESLWAFPAFEGFGLDGRVLAFSLATLLLTALLSGALPAALAGRFDLGDALRDAGPSASSRHGLLRSSMASLQIGLSLTLLVGGLLLTRTVRNVAAVDPGVETRGVQALTLQMGAWTDGPAANALHREILDAARDTPGIESAALQAWYGPYQGQLRRRVRLPGGSDEEPVVAASYWVSHGWFELFGVETLAGRTLEAADWTVGDGEGRVPPVVVTEALARRLFGSVPAALDRTLEYGIGTFAEARIVGVVADVRLRDPRIPPIETFFLPFPGEDTNLLTVLARTSEPDRGASRDALRRAVEAAAPMLPVPDPRPLNDRIALLLAEQRVLGRLLAILSSVAVLLAGVGLYGVVAFGATGRRREFAIRLAFGADRRRIAGLVARSAGSIVTTGIAVGMGGAYALSRLVESRLFGVEPLDPATWSSAAGLLALVAVLACWLPARSATAVDPVATLRQE